MSTAFSLVIYGTDNRLSDGAVLDLSNPKAKLILPGGGVVSGVGISVPSFLTSGPPITGGSGTLTVGLAPQLSGTVFAGPITGPPAIPTFRALSAAYFGLGNVLNVTQEPALGNPAANGYVLSSTMAGIRSWVAAGSGTVTNVASGAGLTGGPITGTGTLAVTGNLAALFVLPDSAGWLHNNGAGSLAYSTPTYTDVGADVAGAAANVTPTTLGLVIGTNVQAYNAKLGTFSALADAAGWLHSTGAGVYAWSTPTAANVGAIPTSLTSAYVLVGNVSNVAAGVAMSGDISITNAGLTAIGANKVTLGMLATQANNTILGNISGGAAVPSPLTGANVRTIISMSTTDSPIFANLELVSPYVGSPTLSFRTTYASGYSNPAFRFLNYLTGAVRWEFGFESGSSGNEHFFIYSDVTTHESLTINNITDAVTLAGSLTTGAPYGGTAAAWKLGVPIASIPIPDHYLQVDIGGHLFAVAAQQLS